MFLFYNVNQTRTEKINLTLNTFNLSKCYITGHYYHLLFPLLSLIQRTITFSTSPIKITVWPNFDLHMFFPLLMSRWFNILDSMLDSNDNEIGESEIQETWINGFLLIQSIKIRYKSFISNNKSVWVLKYKPYIALHTLKMMLIH